jgi:parvulin-like peptidyl-prolyl isomerase
MATDGFGAEGAFMVRPAKMTIRGEHSLRRTVRFTAALGTKGGIRRWKQGMVVVLLAMSLTAAAVIAAETVVAVVNGAPITAGMLDEAIDRLVPRATYHGNVSEERRAEYRDQALEDVITMELQYQDAVARGMKADRKEVSARMQQVRDSFPSSKEYKQWLKGTSLTERALEEKIERVVLVQTAVDAVVNKPSVMSNEALLQYYQQNTEKFRQPESLRLRIVSTKSEAKAREALDRIRAGEDFGNVAARMSEDMYRIKGGDIGFIHRGRIYPALEDAAFKLKTGEVSELIWTEGNWFIVKVEERLPEHLISFDDAKVKLKSALERKRAGQLMSDWIESLKKKATIEIRLNSATSSTK